MGGGARDEHTADSHPSGIALPPAGRRGDWWKDEDLPIDWDARFPGGPLHVEVGFGKGDFLLAMADRHPDCRFAGIERFGEGYRAITRVLRSQDAGNVTALLGDAYIVMNLVFPGDSLAAVYVNYPDPWPKKRHAKRRLYRKEFFDIVGRKLRRGGRLYLATDSRSYARQALEELALCPDLESTHRGRPWLEASPYGVTTRYETKWTAEGRNLHYLVYRKRLGSGRTEPCPT